MASSDTAAPAELCYAAFGLKIASQVELTELAPWERRCDASVDVDIRLGEAPPLPGDPGSSRSGVAALGGNLVFDYPPARYLVVGGERIVVDPKSGASARDVRGYLLGSALGAICHQRGLLPLHANAVEIDGRALAFVGPSGAGKSTLAAALHQLGHRILCDDVCAVSFDPTGRALAWPGPVRIKLWSDALVALDRDVGGLERVFDGEDKFSLPMGADPDLGPAPLARIYALRRSDAASEPGIKRLHGAEALTAVFDNIYRPEFMALLGTARAQLAKAATVAASCEIFEVRRSWGFQHFGGELEWLLKHNAE